jgi:hypothetical protein
LFKKFAAYRYDVDRLKLVCKRMLCDTYYFHGSAGLAAFREMVHGVYF